MIQPVTAYVGIGANQGDPRRQCHQAVDSLAQADGVALRAVSRWRETAPVGPVPQANFVNGVVALHVTCTARQLLGVCLGIEQQMGRVRSERWGPRCIDLDLLLFGEQVIDEPGLCVPHPEMTARAFVMEPLAELAPEQCHPLTGQTFADLAAAFAPEHLLLPVR